jgi:hypothetical protein
MNDNVPFVSLIIVELYCDLHSQGYDSEILISPKKINEYS